MLTIHIVGHSPTFFSTPCTPRPQRGDSERRKNVRKPTPAPESARHIPSSALSTSWNEVPILCSDHAGMGASPSNILRPRIR